MLFLRSRGAPRERRDFEAISLYHRLRARCDAIDDCTWSDLNFDDVFALLDHTTTAIGRQVLYDRLRTPSRDERALREFDALVETARAPKLKGLDGERVYDLPRLFLEPLPKAPRWPWIFPLLSVAALVALILCFAMPAAILAALVIVATNIGIEMFYRRRIWDYIQPLKTLNAFVRAAEEIGEDVSGLKGLRRATAWLAAEREGRDDPMSLAAHYLNMFFLADVNAFVSTLAIVERKRDTLERIFVRIGELDAAHAIASFRASLPLVSKPQFATDFEAQDAYHPLLRDAVPNSIRIAKGILVTGSNMSGKSTFLRTIGVNAVLAQTIYTTCARMWRTPMVDVFSSIGRGDDLLEGKSYYVAEVERIGEFLRVRDRRRLLLLDEIFRGTNAIERIAAARAVLAYMAKSDDIVCAATHDLELVTMLDGLYEPLHFRELIENGALTFDYKLQRGPSSTRNAIALLDLLGYPREVVEEARRASNLEVGRHD